MPIGSELISRVSTNGIDLSEPTLETVTDGPGSCVCRHFVEEDTHLGKVLGEPALKINLH